MMERELFLVDEEIGNIGPFKESGEETKGFRGMIHCLFIISYLTLDVQHKQ